MTQNQTTDTSSSESKLVQSLINAFQADRRAERKRHYVKYGLAAGVVFAYLFTLGLGVTQLVGPSEASKDEPYAALVRVTGEIMPGKSASAEVVNPLLEKAFADKQAKGVVVQINSPGGTPVQSALIHDRINLLKAKYNKKVVMVGEDMMASGAYLIASAGDEIVVNRSTVAGSIGVISAGFGFTGVMEKLGVERRVMTAGESKNLLD
ncbi:S49 family peptidase, partial [Nostoc sp. CHAB 5834]|nr:S49 family peptidase [Nostoc sp. CHAB 5834]